MPCLLGGAITIPTNHPLSPSAVLSLPRNGRHATLKWGQDNVWSHAMEQRQGGCDSRSQTLIPHRAPVFKDTESSPDGKNEKKCHEAHVAAYIRVHRNNLHLWPASASVPFHQLYLSAKGKLLPLFQAGICRKAIGGEKLRLAVYLEDIFLGVHFEDEQDSNT